MSNTSDGRDRTLWIQCACTTVVAIGAAASYRHGREFASRYGADSKTAGIWPVIVDGQIPNANADQAAHRPPALRSWPLFHSSTVARVGRTGPDRYRCESHDRCRGFGGLAGLAGLDSVLIHSLGGLGVMPLQGAVQQFDGEQ